MSIVLIAIVIIAAVGFKFSRSRKIPSPEDSEKSLEQLREESKKWVAEGIIDQPQADRIIGRYSLFEEKRIAGQKDKLVRIFSGFGVILIGVGAILSVAANWEKIPPFLASALLIISTIVTYSIGWWLKYKRQPSPKIGEALILLGSIIFGVSLILISQKYHFLIENSSLILIWGLAVLPLAYITRFYHVLALASILFFGSSFIPIYSSFDYISFDILHYISILLIVLVATPLAYKFKFVKIQALNLVEITIWTVLTLSLFLFKEQSLVAFCLFLIVFGGLILFLSKLHSRSEKYRGFEQPYLALGIIFILVPTFALTFPDAFEKNRIIFSVLFNLIFFAEIGGVIYLGIIKREEHIVNTGIVFFALLVFVRYFSLTWSLGARAVTFITGGVLLIFGSYYIDKMRRKILQRIK